MELYRKEKPLQKIMAINLLKDACRILQSRGVMSTYDAYVIQPGSASSFTNGTH